MNLDEVVVVRLTRGELMTLLTALDRALMEIASDPALAPRTRGAWLREVRELRAVLAEADARAVGVETLEVGDAAGVVSADG